MSTVFIVVPGDSRTPNLYTATSHPTLPEALAALGPHLRGDGDRVAVLPADGTGTPLEVVASAFASRNPRLLRSHKDRIDAAGDGTTEIRDLGDGLHALVWTAPAAA